MQTVLEILKDAEALLEGHFKLTSGRHSEKYIEKIKIIHDPAKVAELCRLLAQKLESIEADIVVGPAMGGIVLAFEVAKNLRKKFVFSQRENDEMLVRSGFPLVKGMKAIIIEDIVTTGGSVFEVMQALEKREIETVGIGVIADRSGGKVDFHVPTFPLLQIDIESWLPEDCPLCKHNVPLSTPGSSGKK